MSEVEKGCDRQEGFVGAELGALGPRVVIAAYRSAMVPTRGGGAGHGHQTTIESGREEEARHGG